MTDFHTTITKRTMQRKHRNGTVSALDRYVLNYNDPASGRRKMQFFKTRKAAEQQQQKLYKSVGEGSALSPKQQPTVAQAVDHWLQHCEGRVSDITLNTYRRVVMAYLVGPALVGSKHDRRVYTLTGAVADGAAFMPMLGRYKISQLTTAQIRAWHQTVLKIATPYVAQSAKKHLSTILAMVAEDFGIRGPAMPRRTSSGYRKKERVLLRQDQVKIILDAASHDKRHGLYYAFPFLTGVRPGEMLGLLWEDVDFVDGVIHIRRNQDINGNIRPFPKTAAGQRTVPMVPSLQAVLLEWRDLCPTREGYPHRVFPALGFETREPGRLVKAGGPLLPCNYRGRIWRPMLKRLGLPDVTPYVARHLVISNLQAQGVEVGMVAKIAGHANPRVTLQHYTHQVRDSAGIMNKLNDAYGMP